MANVTDNMRGALLMSGAMAGFTFNDACMKALGDHMPLFQSLFLRGLGTSLFLVLLAVGMRQVSLRHSRRDWAIMWLRGLAEVGSAWFFITALLHMPIANVSAIMQALPLTMTLAGAVFLGQAVGWRRMTAILIGFGGVMLIVRPGGADFTIHSVYGVLAVLCVTVRDVLSRKVPARVPSLVIAAVSSVAVTLFGGVGSVFVAWQPVDMTALALLAGAIGFLIVGYILSVSAMRVGEIAFVAPFRYTSLLFALAVGFLAFGDWPDFLTKLGAGIVVATGVFTFWRERQRARAEALS